MNDLKAKLHAMCISYVQNRMEAAVQAIDDAQQAANEETKSSAGDKYETGREMMQQEADRSQVQLNEANKLMVALSKINYDNVDSDNIWDLADSGRIIANNWT